MKTLLVGTFVLLASLAMRAQDKKTPVSVAHTGKDQVGALFVEALNRELSHSARYESMNGNEEGFRFYVEVSTIDVADAVSEQGKRSAISVVISEMGFPNSYPVSDMWYHKVILVSRNQVDETAKKLVLDMDASWCTYIRNSIAGCPKEKLEPHLSPE